MKSCSKFLLGAVMTVALSVGAMAASNPVGTWKGRVVIDVAKLPKAPNPQAQQQMNQSLAKAKAMVITLTLKGNKTFTAAVTGSPTKDNNDSGTWTQSGNTVTLKSSKKNMTGAQDSKSMTLSADGKSMTLPSGPFAKVVFKR